MKAKLPPLTWLAAAVVLAVTPACNSVSSSSSRYPGASQLPPSNPKLVEIFHSEPTRPHVRLGEVRVEPSHPNMQGGKIDAALRHEAAKLGADAAVVISDDVQIIGAMPVGGFMGGYQSEHIEPTRHRVIVAMAIKYR
jgi:hypothetical protein